MHPSYQYFIPLRTLQNSILLLVSSLDYFTLNHVVNLLYLFQEIIKHALEAEKVARCVSHSHWLSVYVQVG